MEGIQTNKCPSTLSLSPIFYARMTLIALGLIKDK